MIFRTRVLAALPVECSDVGEGFVDAVTKSLATVGGEAEGFELGEQLRVVLGDGLHGVVEDRAQGPLRSELGVEQAQRASGRIAWIGERLLALGRAQLVYLGEIVPMDHDLSAQGEGLVVRDGEGHAAQGADVWGHVLAGLAVSARESLLEAAPRVDHLDAGPIELGLADVVDLRRPEGLADPPVELAELALAVRIVERKHANPALHLHEAFAW
jgi:hypothetical protein